MPHPLHGSLKSASRLNQQTTDSTNPVYTNILHSHFGDVLLCKSMCGYYRYAIPGPL